MKPSSVLIGIETEYGLLVEGRGPQDQIQDSADFVRSYPGYCFIGWDYRFESPRADLRGFKLDHLAQDPIDAQFDRPGAPVQTSAEIRSDRVLSNGARFYNDHGHPEYATPECHSLAQLVALDHVGETVLRETAPAFGRRSTRTTPTSTVPAMVATRAIWPRASWGSTDFFPRSCRC